MKTPPQSIAFVSPRFPDGPTIGGAETLLKHQARYAVEAGLDVTFCTTCARDHFTWQNELEPGKRVTDGIPVHYFPVDGNRELEAFLRVQNRISRRAPVSDDDAMVWLKQNVNSTPLIEHLQSTDYDRVVIGPYLFGLSYFAAAAKPDRSVLVPCLHDEAFAYLSPFKQMFTSARSVLFNSHAERDLAARLYSPALATMPIVGMGMPPFTADPNAFAMAHGMTAPYVLYCGRREPLKGTPLLLDYMDAFRARTKHDVKVVLTGSGPVHPSPALAPHVIDLGFVSETEKRDVMAGALAFCHPSVNESFGIVVLESWLAARPTLVHAGSAVLQDLCRRANAGLWFKTYAEFELELLALLDTPNLGNQLGAAGRQYVLDTYDPRQVAATFIDALAR